MSNSVRVAVIDDQLSYLDGICFALSRLDGVKICARTTSLNNGMQLCVDAAPDVIVVDYRLPGDETGTTFARSLRQLRFDVPIVILTGFVTPLVVREADALADVHVLSKARPLKDVLCAIVAMALRNPQIDTETPCKPSRHLLSAGELEVLEQLCHGHSPAEIAQHFCLSVHSVRARIKQIHRKLDVTSLGEMVAVAYRTDLVAPPA